MERMRPRAELSPHAVTTIAPPGLSTTTVPPYKAAPGALGTSAGSPVSMDSSTLTPTAAPAAAASGVSRSTPSAGTASPSTRRTTSPTWQVR